MADHAIVRSSTLHGIADAIIAKGGATGPLLPSAMPDAIAAIQTTTVEVPEKHVNFYDYDGKRLYSYTWEEARSLNELPPLPTRDGMVCTGWNWSSDNLESMVSTLFPAVEPPDGLNREGIVDIGALYTPASGATELCVGFDDGEKHSFKITFTPSSGASVTVRLGDESVSRTGDGNLMTWERSFTAGAGEWKTISITVEGGECVFNGVDSPKDLREFRLGNNMTSLGVGALRDCTRLEYASFAPLTSVDGGGYQLCNTGLVCVILPTGLPSFPTQFLSLNPRLRVLSMGYAHSEFWSMCQFTDPGHISFSMSPESAARPGVGFAFSFVTVVDIPESIAISNQGFQHCTRLVKIRSPQVVLMGDAYATFLGCSRLNELPPLIVTGSISDAMFAGCRSLESVKFIPLDNTSFNFVGWGIFDGCTSLKSIDLTEYPSGHVATVRSDAFSNTMGVHDRVFSPDTGVYPGPYVLQGTLPPQITVYVRASDLESWNNHPDWAVHVASRQVVFEGV